MGRVQNSDPPLTPLTFSTTVMMTQAGHWHRSEHCTCTSRPIAPVAAAKMFANKSVLNILASDLNNAVQELDKIKAEWTKKNMERAIFLSNKDTVWHAASQFKTDEGRASWKYIQANPETWKQDERGPFGETPLHIALLFNPPSQELIAMFMELWDMSDREVRIAEYNAEPFTGENILHIAIMKKVGKELTKKIVETEKSLLNGKTERAKSRSVSPALATIDG
jgi:hypothetical protein